MDQAAVQALFRQFAAPLAGYAAASPERQELAELLIRNLWTAMIAGPDTEEEMWKFFKTTCRLDDDSLHVIRQVYFDEMKPVVTEDQILELRHQFRRRRNEQE